MMSSNIHAEDLAIGKAKSEMCLDVMPFQDIIMYPTHKVPNWQDSMLIILFQH